MLDQAIRDVLDQHALTIEGLMDGDVLTYDGPIHPNIIQLFRDTVERLVQRGTQRKRLIFVLTTFGGSAETAEHMAEIVRHHYEEVYFVVPTHAMSAGTILCMSGDQIHMDYTSTLGPIDPQVVTEQGGQPVPALGHLNKLKELLQKAKEGTLTAPEYDIVVNQNLAQLKMYEQAKELSIVLLKEWLVKYKFKDWTIHRSNEKIKGQPVTSDEKVARAERIADALSDNQKWCSHGRRIGINTLVTDIGLEIEDIEKTRLVACSAPLQWGDERLRWPRKNTLFYAHREMRSRI